MIIVKIQDLPKVGGSEYGSKYARVCDSNEITYLNETNCKISFIDRADWEDGFYSCKGWGCPGDSVSFRSGDSKCGVGYAPNNPRNFIRIPDSHDQALKYSTPCENYENAYRVNIPGKEVYIIGCPNGLEVLDSSVTPVPQQSNEIINLDKTSFQLSVGAIVGIVFASIAGVAIIFIIIGVVGFLICAFAKRGAGKHYSLSDKII